nr:ABC transporter permease [Cytobacillus eiseniae]
MLALFLPIIIILVLNTAYSGLFNSDSESVNIDVALVQEDNEALGLERFADAVNGLEMSSIEKETLLEQAAQITPVRLIDDFFSNPELKKWINIKELKEEEATELVETGELDAIIKIPEGFTYEVLSHLMLDEQSEVALTIQAEEQSTEVSVLRDVTQNFIDTINLQFALGGASDAEAKELELPQGGTEVVEGVETFSMTQYFTIGMSTLFALFISQTIAIKTVTEKRERVFNRILLTNSNPIHYLTGKMLATFCLTWLQLVIIFTSMQFILDVFTEKPLVFWIGLLAVITAFALTVAGLSALFTILTLYLHDSNAVSGLTSLIVMMFGFLGGSFFPIQGFPELLRKIGEWTPNGLVQTTLIKLIQFNDLQDLMIPIIFLIGMFIVCLTIGIAFFPKRGRI